MSEERCVMCNKPVPEGKMVCYECEDIEPSFDTIQIKISLNKISDISKFSSLASKCKDDVLVKSDRFVVNAKSLMALYSLDLTKPLKVEFYGNVPYDVAEEMKKFIVD